jgi:hypothetical protein
MGLVRLRPLYNWAYSLHNIEDHCTVVLQPHGIVGTTRQNIGLMDLVETIVLRYQMAK